MDNKNAKNTNADKKKNDPKLAKERFVATGEGLTFTKPKKASK